MVSDYLNRSGYICQALQILVASYKDNSEIDAGTSLEADTNKSPESDTEAAMSTKVSGNDGKSKGGRDLQLGIQMAPSCVSPKWAWSLRTFPQSDLDRILDFIKFNLLEPMRRAT